MIPEQSTFADSISCNLKLFLQWLYDMALLKAVRLKHTAEREGGISLHEG